MGLYRNIAGSQMGIARDYFTVAPDDGGGGGGTGSEIYPGVPVQAVNPVGVQPVAIQPAADEPLVYYDPWFAEAPVTANEQPVAVLPLSDPEVVYEVRKDEPVTPIQQVDTDQTIYTLQPGETSTAQVDNGPDTKNIFPLLTLAFLYANMIAGDSFLGQYRHVGFVGGLGLLYYQFNKRAGQVQAL